jgi:hypothetical protein
MARFKLLTCNALAHCWPQRDGEEVERRVMEIALHVDPARLRARLLQEIASLDEPGVDIVLGYGLCGRGLEGVVSSESRLILPRVDDCVGALLGSRERHRRFTRERPRCYFLAPHWLDTELNIFTEILKGMDRIPIDRRGEIAKQALKHYDTLAVLSSKDTDPVSMRRIKIHARDFGLQILKLPTDATLLHRLISGPWPESEFVVCEPGQPIPFF